MICRVIRSWFRAIVQSLLIDSGRVLSMQYPSPLRFVRNRRGWSSDYVRPLQFGGGGEAEEGQQ